MSNWIWLNLVVGAPFVLTWVGVPLWLVIKRPDTGPALAPVPGRQHAAAPAAAAGPGRRPAVTGTLARSGRQAA